MMSRPRIYLVLIMLFAALATAVVFGASENGLIAWMVWMDGYSLVLVALVLLLWLFLGFRRQDTRGIRTSLLAALMMQLFVTAFVVCGHFENSVARAILMVVVVLSLPGLFVAQALNLGLDIDLCVIEIIGFLQWFLFFWLIVFLRNRIGGDNKPRRVTTNAVPPIDAADSG